MILSSSIIASDAARLGAQAREALDAGVDWLHIDAMDGRFAPNITVGPFVVEALRPLADETGAKLDVHLMIEEPRRYVDDFIAAGADIVTVHVEGCAHLRRVLAHIRSRGALAGVTLKPATPLSAIEEALPDADMALVMSVDPGFSGQKYIPESTEKIRRLRDMLDRMGSRAWLQVDGGVHAGNIREVAQAGATAAVAGSAVFGGASIADNVQALRNAARSEGTSD